eukprot:Seg1986.2 transcript_id=Seg1986.2/GoldUCD/mRNA.D3Y31 product="Vesicular glutamate transporter 1" protein_id=Seg1986.2/GoldUCD/D3Y31
MEKVLAGGEHENATTVSENRGNESIETKDIVASEDGNFRGTKIEQSEVVSVTREEASIQADIVDNVPIENADGKRDQVELVMSTVDSHSSESSSKDVQSSSKKTATTTQESVDTEGEPITMSETLTASHSEDKAILFDPVSYMHEMQIPDSERTKEEYTVEDKKSCTCMQKRHLIALLSFFGFFNVYCLRVDLSITLVAMTNRHTRVTLMGEEWTAEPEFDWDTKLQGHILGSFFYGYLITQIPGGYIAARFGGKNLFGLAILMTSLLTLLTPWACRQHVMLLIAVRFLEGVCEGCIYPCMYAIWSKWAPPLERSKLTTIPHAGSFGILWSITWFCIAVDSPSLDRNITPKEKKYIEDSLKDDNVSVKVSNPPWLKFMTSVPFLAILIAHTCEGWGFSTMQTSLPKFLSEALGMRISVAGIYSAILYFMMGIVVLSGGQLADLIRRHGILSTTNVRKLFTCTGFLLQALAFTTSIHFTNIHVGVLVLVIGGGIEGLAWAGFAVNHLDIAPRYASILFGITNTSATIPGILSPLLVGYITENKTKEEWRLVFYIGSATFAVGAIVYGLLASAEKQPWADDNNHDDYKLLTGEDRNQQNQT